MATLIAVYSTRAGQTSTYWATSLAWTLAESRRVMLVDADMEGGTIADLLYLRVEDRSLGNCFGDRPAAPQELDEQSLAALRLKAEDMKEWPLYLDDSSFLTINQLRGKARRMKDRFGIELLVIDYLQLLHSESDQAKDNRQNEVAEISRGIKALAKELSIPIIILAQLNRRSEEAKAEPALHNLRESGAIEQDADVVLLLHRNEPDKDEDGNATPSGPVIPYKLNIAKQRNGPTDKLDILFHAPYTRFDDPVRHEARSKT